jgi:hypothetical protein
MYIREKWPRKRQRGGAKEEIPPVSGVVCSNTPPHRFYWNRKEKKEGLGQWTALKEFVTDTSVTVSVGDPWHVGADPDFLLKFCGKILFLQALFQSDHNTFYEKREGFGAGSVPLTIGSGRPENMRIRILISNTDSSDEIYHCCYSRRLLISARILIGAFDFRRWFDG